jgi:hypothetical protein
MPQSRKGSQLDARLAAKLRAAIQRHGAAAVSRASGVSPIALASAAAGSHVVALTAERVERFLAQGIPVPPGAGVGLRHLT